MTRIGFVGVGKHAQRMAAAFRECGAEIVAYDRETPSVTPGNHHEFLPTFGERTHWTRMLVAPNIDALIICAPPEVTTEVALACAKAGKRFMATKPLLWSFDRDCFNESGDLYARPEAGGPISFYCDSDRGYVDLWRLYSPAWQAMKAELRGKQIQSVHVDFYGDGPSRGFPGGILDYAPHALAFLADFLGEVPELEWQCAIDPQRRYRQKATGVGDMIRVNTGNDYAHGRMAVSVLHGDNRRTTWVEAGSEHFIVDEVIGHPGTRPMTHDRSLALRNFCRAFIAAEPSDTLRISCEAMRVLMPLVS